MKKYATTIAVVISALALASCASSEAYNTLSKNEIHLAGHPYKSAKDCKRKAPIGKFDAKCDIPVVGFRNFSDPTIGIGTGGIGGFSVAP